MWPRIKAYVRKPDFLASLVAGYAAFACILPLNLPLSEGPEPPWVWVVVVVACLSAPLWMPTILILGAFGAVIQFKLPHPAYFAAVISYIAAYALVFQWRASYGRQYTGRSAGSI